MAENGVKGGEMTDPAQQPEQSEISRWSVLEWFAVFSATVLLVSISWEWGYWSAFGISFREIPISFTDMADNPALLPIAMISFCGVVIFALQLRARGFRINAETVSGRPRLAKFLRFLASKWLLIFTLVLAALQVHFWGEINILFLFVFFLELYTFVWLWLWRWFFWHPRAPSHPGLAMFFIFVPVLCPTIYCLGWLLAVNAANATPTLMYLKMGESIQEKRLALVKNTHNFVYAYDSEKNALIMFPWSSVHGIVLDATPEWNIRVPFVTPRIKSEKVQHDFRI